MEDLIDIQGLDYIGWWPLAWGWWLLIGLTLVSSLLLLVWAVRTYKYKRSWQYQAHNRLRAIQQQIGQQQNKDILQNISVEIRKIAMLTTSREACAGLIGERWLRWLQEHDPAGFNWLDKGAILVDMQYMPEPQNLDHIKIHDLIHAAQGWVKKC